MLQSKRKETCLYKTTLKTIYYEKDFILLATTMATASTFAGGLGDVNNDNRINQTDIDLVQNHIAENLMLKSGFKNRADVNQDGVINLQDVVAMQQAKAKRWKDGDINGDGKLTNADVTLLQNYMADNVTLDGFQMIKADFNKDGKISMSDVTDMQRAMAK